jgi:hypothetical protein
VESKSIGVRNQRKPRLHYFPVHVPNEEAAGKQNDIPPPKAQNLIRGLFRLLDHPLEPASGGAIRVDELEACEVGPELAEERALVAAVVLANDGLDSLGGLLSVVEGDAPGKTKELVTC